MTPQRDNNDTFDINQASSTRSTQHDDGKFQGLPFVSDSNSN